MTGNDRSRFGASNHSSPMVAAKDDDFLRNSIAHQLRNYCFETLDSTKFLQPAADGRRISGAISFSLDPRLLRLLFADARISIVLALQRHLDNERYRRRLKLEPHYRALRPHLSASFRLLMIPPSNWAGYHYPVSRKPTLILAYQNEIERLEMELHLVPEKIASHVQNRVRRWVV
jgi:hypothetical protein